MKSIQKLGIGASVVSSVIIFIYLCLIIYSFADSENNLPDATSYYTNIFFFAWLNSLFILLMVYYDTLKVSKIALAVFFVAEIPIALMLGFFGFIIFAYGNLGLGLPLMTAAVLSVIAVFIILNVKNQ